MRMCGPCPPPLSACTAATYHHTHSPPILHHSLLRNNAAWLSPAHATTALRTCPLLQVPVLVREGTVWESGQIAFSHMTLYEQSSSRAWSNQDVIKYPPHPNQFVFFHISNFERRPCSARCNIPYDSIIILHSSHVEFVEHKDEF